MEIYYMYTKLRRDFGRHPNFQDEPAEVLADIRPDANVKQDFIDRNPVITNVQVVQDMSEHEANTEMVEYRSSGMFHMEGGWPKDIDFTEVEHTIRYRKKVEKDEDYINAIAQLGAQVEELIKQNNAIDIYEEYFQGSNVDHSSETPYAKTLTVFRDPAQDQVRRSASYISWHPDGSRKLAVAYSILEFQKQPDGMPVSSYIWDVNNPNSPDTEMTAASQIVCTVYNPKDPNILATGLYNGQVCYWDGRKSTRAIDTSPIEHSHRDPVYDIVWLQSKTGTEMASCSTDGSAFWWDIRRMGEPVDTLTLVEKGEGKTVLGGVCMEYDSAAGPTKFMVGTEQGTVLLCNRKAKNPADRVAASYLGHHGPVYALQRNPFFIKYFMSIGDWTARIWMEDLKTSIMTTKYHSSYLTGGGWSPTRPGVFYTIKMDGSMDVWDYFYKQNDPTLTVQVTDQGLSAMNVDVTGRHIGVGAVDGSVTLLEVCDGLSMMQVRAPTTALASVLWCASHSDPSGGARAAPRAALC
jgi:dynein intermediate chain 2